MRTCNIKKHEPANLTVCTPINLISVLIAFGFGKYSHEHVLILCDSVKPLEKLVHFNREKYRDLHLFDSEGNQNRALRKVYR